MLRLENISVRVACLLLEEVFIVFTDEGEGVVEVFVVFRGGLLGVSELLASTFPLRFWRSR